MLDWIRSRFEKGQQPSQTVATESVVMRTLADQSVKTVLDEMEQTRQAKRDLRSTLSEDGRRTIHDLLRVEAPEKPLPLEGEMYPRREKT